MRATSQLVLGRNTHRIVFTGDGRFEIRSLGAVARFEPAGGSVDKIVLRGLEDGALREEGVRLKPFDTSGTGLEEFAGEYESPELPIPYFITLEDDRLTFHALKRNPNRAETRRSRPLGRRRCWQSSI